MIVDFTDPDGAENMISFPAIDLLHYIENLFFDLFQFILHTYYNVLHLGMIGFTSGGIDFASHFLSNETKLFALSMSFVHGFTEIIQMIGKALLFFVYIQFFDIVYQFLF